jgi:hypothetical protein
MAELSNHTITNLYFNAHEGPTLIAQVEKVILLIFPRGLLVAGFNASGDLLMINYTAHNDSMPTWILDFYEHSFIDNKLLQAPEKIAGVFIATEKYLIIPDELFSEGHAEDWLKKIFFVESGETTDRFRLHEDKAHYLFAYSTAIKNLATRYFHVAPVLPLACYQFHKPYKMDAILQCCITPDQVIATLYKNQHLTWHQNFAYSTAEDIAYQIGLMSKQYRLDSQNMDFHVSVVHKELNNVVLDLTQYYPKLKYGNDGDNIGHSKEWNMTSNLLQQLISCVS